jgi:cyclohexadienyl dehydratase
VRWARPLLAALLLALAPAAPPFASEAATLYTQRCAPCHEQNRADVPSRAAMAGRSSAFIVEKLAFGSMQTPALGLSDAQIEAIATHLASGTPGAPGTPGAAPAAGPGSDRLLRFGLTADYPPFATVAADGSLVGADVEAARRVAHALGARAEFVRTGWTTLAADFAAGRFDVVIGGLTVTPERAAHGTFSIALMEDGKRPLARCAERERYGTVDAINRPGVRLMINRGPSMPELVRQLFPRATLTVNTDDASLIPRLLENEVDVWVTDGVVVDDVARRYPGQLCATTGTPFTRVTKAWLIRNDAALVAGIDRELAAELRSGAWRRDLERGPEPR